MKHVRNSTAAFLIAAVLTVVPALTATAQDSPPNVEEQGSIDRTGRAGETVQIEVENDGLLFYPAEIIVTEGTTVEITFVNTGGPHDWNLDAFGVDMPVIRGGSETTATFTADEAGEYEYYCSVGNHRARGMWGYFIVEER
jgi:plastocyanin